MKTIGAPRVADFFPVLKVIDLSQRNEADWHRKDKKHLFLGLFVAGTDTIAELLRNPEKLRKATAEIREVVGLGNLFKNQTFQGFLTCRHLLKRPLLVRQAETDIEIDQLLVNLWAIGSLWPNPHSFLPERFLDGEIDVKGQHFELREKNLLGTATGSSNGASC
ncbi:unnamed protein product [Coffea canephora]|uniref:DH200=94 genomic scaffold, scaffold_67 n=1 Tax=Coffea canephora TaxID=49390 RepID=A0A068UVQ5_COFCA|nr:unnamed protein product [Coffea canephora]